MGVGVSIILIAAGAILRGMVTATVAGVSIIAIGVILIVFGVIGLIAGLITTERLRRKRSLAEAGLGDVRESSTHREPSPSSIRTAALV